MSLILVLLFYSAYILTMVRILVVGAGVTGSLCAYMVRKHLPTQLQCQIVVWEKSRGVGGRMSMSRPPATFGDKTNSSSDVSSVSPISKDCGAELGAQYITQYSQYADSHRTFYDELTDCDVLQPLKGKIEGFRGEEAQHFVSKAGLNSIAKHFFAKSLVKVYPNMRLESLRLTTKDTNSWSVWEAATTNGRHDHFDAVILTIPVPQILDIAGIKDELDEGQIDDLEAVQYSSRFAVGLFYKPGSFNLDLPYVAKYVSDGDIIRYVAVDNKKRGASGEFTSIVVHTSGPFGKAHIEEDAESVGQKVLQELYCLLPELPKPNHVKYHKWRYSQVLKPSGKFNGCLALRTKPLLVMTGDAFTHSNFDGCIEAALKVDKELENWVKDAV